MKKIACIVLALLLCLSMAAMAESVPSRTTTDLTTITVAAENMPADIDLPLGRGTANFTLTPITEVDPANMTPEMQVRVEACNAEIAKLNESGNAVEYFGEVTDANGNAVSLTELLGTDEVNVYEFFPLSAEGFEVEYGAVTATMVFSTPYEEGQQVAVLVGIVTENADGTQSVAWQVFDGVGTSVAEGSGIEVTFTPEILEQVQNGTALMAVVSR